MNYETRAIGNEEILGLPGERGPQGRRWGLIIGIVAGGVIGPAVGLLVPATLAHETAPLGSAESAEHYAIHGTHADPPAPGAPDP